MSQLWGLFSQNSYTGVPLKSLDISIKILHNVAKVLYTQVYYNESQLLVESKFFFPISPDACFDSFQATFNGTTITGVIKKKEEAKEAYNNAVQQGHTAAYSEINEETGDIMKVQIGNIPPKTEIAITYSYIQKLDTILNKFWCFRLFSTITSRYNSDPEELKKADISLLMNYPTLSPKDSKAYPWNIEVEIQSPSPIEVLQSLSHGITTEFGNERHTCKIHLDKKTKHLPNKDFILMFNNGKEDKIDYLLTPFEDGYCAMVTLLADFEAESAAKLVSESVKAKDVSYTTDMIRGEYIFLIDRSGSMSGDRIEMAKNSLIVFLKSLPKDSYYNIISFGSGYEFLSKSSEKYSSNTLENTINKVHKFGATMGGTNIFLPLRQMFETPLKQGYPRFIFLLTDGAVSNTAQVLTLIKDNNEKARVFTIGVGNGCSPELIVRGASYGRGKHEFVANSNETYEKVVSLLNASLSPCFSDLSFEAENFDAVVKSVSPNPSSIPFLLNGQPVTFFVFLREAAFENDQKFNLALRFYDSRTKEYRKVGVTLEADNAIENQLIPKLGIHDMIRRLEEQKQNTSKDKLHVLWLDKAEIQNALLELSLKYGILCKETAFFCEVSKNDSEILDIQSASVTVPSIVSSDYAYSSYLPRGMGAQRNVNLQYYGGAQKSAGCCSEGGGSGSYNYPRGDLTDQVQSVPLSKYEKLCVDIIMKHNFEGFWDPKDKELNFIIVKLGKLPDVPKEIDVAGGLSETAWMTVLVLLWLEKACENQKKIWLLIHQKAKEWLKSKGISYEEVKALGESIIKAE